MTTDQDNVNIDPRIYGGLPVTAQPASVAVRKDVTPTGTDPVRAPLANDTIGGQAAADGAAVTAEANRPRATSWEGIKAAAREWTTTHIIDTLKAPSFPPEAGFNAADALRFTATPFDLESERFLLKAKSQEEFNYKVQSLQDQFKNRQMIGDNPVLGGVVGMFDPVYFGIDVVSLGAGRLVSAGRAGRVVAGITAATGSVGANMIENEQVPVSTTEIVTNALLNGALTSFAFRGGKLERTAPDYPVAELEAAAHKLQPEAAKAPTMKWAQKFDDAGEPVLVNGKPVYTRVPDEAVARSTVEAAAAKAVADDTAVISAMASSVRRPETWTSPSGRVYKTAGADSIISEARTSPDPMVNELAQVLSERAGPVLADVQVVKVSADDLKHLGGREGYHADSHRIVLTEGSKAGVQLHELAHAATVSKIKYGQLNPTSATGAIVQDLDDIRKLAATQAKGDLSKYLTGSTEEFVAGLFSGNTEFTQLLAGMKDPGGMTSLFSRAVDAVRRALGFSTTESNALLRAMRLTDDLMAQALPKTDSGIYHAPQALVGKHVESMAAKVGDKLQWNLHNSLAKFDQDAANRLIDSPLDLTRNSADSYRVAIRNELTNLQRGYEDELVDLMAERGAGIRQRVFTPGKAVEVQKQIEKEVAIEMYARDDAARSGVRAAPPADPRIAKLADSLDRISEAALAEMKTSRVAGADVVQGRAGYFSRRWDSAKLDSITNDLMKFGRSKEAAQAEVTDWVIRSLQSANGWSHELASDVGRALIDRTIRKGEFSDAAFRSHVGNEALAEVRDILKGSGVRGDRLQRAMDVLAGKVDEAGKQPFLKHRVDLDLGMPLRMPDGTTRGFADILDTNISNITDRYLDTVAGQSALARVGLDSPTAIGEFRTNFVNKVPHNQRGEAVDLLDNTLNYLQGFPTGAEYSAGMRKLQAVTQMVGLASSGLWQITEYATAMGKYGLLKAGKYALANLPGFRDLFPAVKADKAMAESLSNVLARQSYNDVRLRPFIQRMDDNFEFNISDQAMLGLSQAKQLVPYLNAMKYVHHHQSQMVANLVTDTLVRGVKGDAKAVKSLAQYGLEPGILAQARKDIDAHGIDTGKWSDETWRNLRPGLARMMDESVLKNRAGDIPAFAQFSPIGKFLFTFRSFVLGAHNKLLAGGLSRNGFMGVGLVAMYQFPLALAAVGADSAIKGKTDDMTPEKLAAKAVSQMGIMGLFSEVWGVVSGQKQQFGTPGLLAVDRAMGFAGHVSQGNWGQAGNDLINTVPLLPLIPGIKAMGESLKE
ncbi:hypothetical protein Axy23_041 [Achromobacter phage vB_AxyP_19-32_Axy23]|uniref:Internal core protein n=1 Tax=Achromobacter phage vB_AxyP_19-32_Axy23 TaxID=2591047 RepID=A0A514CW06_9CAUD|nr:hypothetical protein Axy23_041 [Achromobacter phage vB_AxyP_19-32_Axy23]